ncbi:nuclear transport factor 2 family protein [Kitasatospora sp. NPDC004531]
MARLEAIEKIRQLAARYALALDSRDLPALAALFIDDVRTHDGRVGRPALADRFGPVLRPFGVTFHLIGNQVLGPLERRDGGRGPETVGRPRRGRRPPQPVTVPGRVTTLRTDATPDATRQPAPPGPQA